MRFDVITIFPEVLQPTLEASIMARAQAVGHIEVVAHNPRDWTTDKHRTMDDTPYGGGGGMVMRAEPLLACIREVRAGAAQALGVERVPVIYMSPQGRTLDRDRVIELSELPGAVLLCGSYEGVDERVIEAEVDDEISIGDYVLTGGELAALIVMNAAMRHLEGVLGNEASAANDSFENGLLDFPHYTRPEVVEGRAAPGILLSGHHANIERWRRDQSLERTARRRPDLLAKAPLDKKDLKYLKEKGLWPLPEEEA